MEMTSDCPYRSVKSASRGMARSIHAVESISDELTVQVESLHTFDREKDAPQPRAIETKALRFAITAELVDQVADMVLVGEGPETRLPLIKSTQKRDPSLDIYDPSVTLMNDWFNVDYHGPIQEVIVDPKNREIIELYSDIAEDISTDPDADEDYNSLGSDNPLDILFTRLSPSTSFELTSNMTFIIRMVQQLAAGHSLSPEECREIALDNIELFSRLSQLEINHSDRYTMNVYGVMINELDLRKSGIEFQMVNGAWKLVLTKRHRKPAKSYGPPVGCPAGFDLEPDSSCASELSQDTSLHRYAIAYLNEAYDRGLFKIA